MESQGIVVHGPCVKNTYKVECYHHPFQGLLCLHINIAGGFTIRLIFIAVGGAIGTLLRYGISGIIYRVSDPVFPWGTLGVNLIGSFIAGFLWEAFERTAVSPDIRTFVFIGILGGFTTFSSYNLESFNLLRDGEIKLALSNVFVSNILGISLVFTGYAASRYLAGLFR